MSTTRLVLFDAKSHDESFFAVANQRYGFDLKFMPYRLSAETVGLVPDGCVVCAFVNDELSAPVGAALAAKGVRLVALRCAGYNNVDLQSFFGKIHVVRVPAYSPHSVAEHTLALILTLNRKTHRAYYRTRDHNFTLAGLMGFDLHGRTAGVVGTGKIGRLVAEILRGFGMQVLAFDIHPDAEWAAACGVRMVDQDELFRAADVLTLHCPLTPDSHHLINQRSLALMKDGVMIINTGRGGLINTVDLLAALKNLKVGAAGLDVYEEEDRYFFEDFSNEIVTDDTLSRLLTFPNVLVTSHQAFFTHEALTSIAETTLDNVRAFVDHGQLRNEICYQCGTTPCRRQQQGECWPTPGA